jgi:hypothetical protein
MVRSYDIALILSAGLLAAGLRFNQSEGNGSAWSSCAWPTELLAIVPQPPRPAPACLGAEATLERWGDLRPSRQTFHALPAQQPRGARRGLLSMDGSGSPMKGEFGDGPLSVIAPGGAPLCSVNALYGTGTGAVCSTLSTGCLGEPDPRLAPDGAVAAGSPLAWAEGLLRAERASRSRICE